MVRTPSRKGGRAVSECIFCRIAAGDLPARLLRDEPDLVAIADLHPQAPTHVLVLPRAHWTSLDAVPPQETPALGRLLAVCRDLARELELGDGYRVVVNTGPAGGQTVDHLHLHLLGGRPMAWPPG